MDPRWNRPLPPLQGLSINNAARGQKRSSPSSSSDVNEPYPKWQSLCSAPWSLMLDGAVKALGPHLYTANEQTMPSLQKINYEHTFCWRDKKTGRLDDGMVFGVLGHRVYAAGKWLYVFRPTLRSSTSSENSWLWYTMKKELGHGSIMQTVSCGNDAPRINNQLNSFLGPWIEFYARHFETQS